MPCVQISPCTGSTACLHAQFTAVSDIHIRLIIASSPAFDMLLTLGKHAWQGDCVPAAVAGCDLACSNPVVSSQVLLWDASHRALSKDSKGLRCDDAMLQSGRIAVYGDSNCLDSSHQRSSCYNLLIKLIQYTAEVSAAAAHGPAVQVCREPCSQFFSTHKFVGMSSAMFTGVMRLR